MVSEIPSVTVLIPTRNRRDEVAATVECVLRSTYPNLVVQVFDNCSQDGTAELLEQRFGSDIRLARSDQPLAMVDSFEKAYALVSTDWVFGLGADDGLHRDAISMLVEAVLQHDVLSAVPQRSQYMWPGALEKYPRGALTIPGRAPTFVRSTSDAVRCVLQGKETWTSLPTAYYGLAHMSILSRHRSRRGRLINSWTPDLYLSLAVAGEINRFVTVGAPLMIAGTSRNSTGLSQFKGRNSEPVAEFVRLNAESEVSLHPTVASVDGSLPASIQILTLEAFLQTESRVGLREWILCTPRYQAFAHEFFTRGESPHDVALWIGKFARTDRRDPLAIALSIASRGEILFQWLRHRHDKSRWKMLLQAIQVRVRRIRSLLGARLNYRLGVVPKEAGPEWSKSRIEDVASLQAAEDLLHARLAHALYPARVRQPDSRGSTGPWTDFVDLRMEL